MCMCVFYCLCYSIFIKLVPAASRCSATSYWRCALHVLFRCPARAWICCAVVPIRLNSPINLITRPSLALWVMGGAVSKLKLRLLHRGTAYFLITSFLRGHWLKLCTLLYKVWTNDVIEMMKLKLSEAACISKTKCRTQARHVSFESAHRVQQHYLSLILGWTSPSMNTTCVKRLLHGESACS